MGCSRRSSVVLVSSIAMLVGLGMVAGCNDARCDEGYTLVGGECRVGVDAGQPDSGPPDAAPPDSGTDAGSTANLTFCEMQTTDGGMPHQFGDVCRDGASHTDCGCPAHYCAIQPGMSEGYCTATGCVQNPDVCPAGWTCFDLTAIAGPQYPSICIRSQ